jgi:hypothetical protein
MERVYYGWLEINNEKKHLIHVNVYIETRTSTSEKSYWYSKYIDIYIYLKQQGETDRLFQL